MRINRRVGAAIMTNPRVLPIPPSGFQTLLRDADYEFML